jgi:DNA-binding SARP family transcriptional activator
VEFGVLGPVEVRAAGQVCEAGYPKQRAVLAVLLLDLGRMVPSEQLIDRVWGEDPPPSVRNVLYGYVSRLRAVLAGAADPLVTLTRHPGGYLLRATPEQLDLHGFRRLVAAAAAAAGDDRRAGRLLREALSQWRGPALAGVDSPWLNAMRDTLEAERAAAVLDLNDIRLRAGEHGVLVSELARQARARPADERLIGQLMLALYRSGRQAEALRCFEQTRRWLADELGADPEPGLRALHQQVLQADPALTLPAVGAARPAPCLGARAARGVRRPLAGGVHRPLA